jgi:hypothetical protein
MIAQSRNPACDVAHGLAAARGTIDATIGHKLQTKAPRSAASARNPRMPEAGDRHESNTGVPRYVRWRTDPKCPRLYAADRRNVPSRSGDVRHAKVFRFC